MRLRRILTYLNWLIGIALFLFAAAVFWFAWRPLPKTSGRIEAPVAQPATITRDSLGVPHIKAGSIDDAIFLQGFATAQDRMWQMDAIRRFANGDLSEVMGARSLQLDIESRKLRMRRIAEEHAKRLSADDRRYMAAYARGVNYYIETQTGKLPLEFALLRYQPRPWTIADSIAVGLQMHRDLTTTWRDDVNKAAMFAAGDPKLVSQLYPARSGAEPSIGSNAWAVAGRLSTTGKPILANDPHLRWGVPPTWHMAHIEAPGFQVAGAALPGVPGIIVGHNARIAWGVTNLGFDVQDLYLERLDTQSGQFVHEGRVATAVLEREVIPVKGQGAEQFQNWVTPHGPVWTQLGPQPLTLRWTAAEAGLFEFPFVQLNKAQNWSEFRDALRRFHGPGQNFVYADVDGNIGYQATGALPIRRNYDGTVPADGTSGQFEWQGFISFDELPSIYNPASGMVVTANQNPFPKDSPYTISGDFSPGYRAQQIQTLLKSRSRWSTEDMVAIQKDVYSPVLHSVAREVVRAADARQYNDDGIESLRKWDGQTDKESAAAMIAALVYTQLATRLVARAAPKADVATYTSRFSTAAVESIVRERRTGWFKDWSATIMEAYSAALEQGKKEQGGNPAKWRYGIHNEVHLRHPVVSQIPYIGAYYNVGPAPMSGSGTSVKQTSPIVSPSMRFVANTADWDRSLNNVTLGESGHVLSSHFRDQWDAYYNGRSFPTPWREVKGDVLRVDPRK